MIPPHKRPGSRRRRAASQRITATTTFRPGMIIPYFREGIEVAGKLVSSPPAPVPDSPTIEADGPITIGLLRERGHGLMVICRSCGHPGVYEAEALSSLDELADDLAVSEAGAVFRSDCCPGAEMETRPAA